MMGTGCRSVVRVFNDDTDISVGIWPDNRLGVVRAMRVGTRGSGGTAYGDKGSLHSEERVVVLKVKTGLILRIKK